MTQTDQSRILPGIGEIDFSGLSRQRLEDMAAAGEEVMEVHRVLEKTGDNLVGELIKDAGTFYEWNHYPDGDVYDTESHSQYYYHAHPAELRVGEHGHFHTFLRPKGMPKGVKPAPIPDLEPPDDEDDALSHLIAISMDSHGIPICLFTTNRWVTGEVWYKAEDICAMLDSFVISHAQPSWPVNRWVGAMIRLFHPQVAALVRLRDAVVEEWAKQHPGRDVFEDRDLEVASAQPISLADQIEKVGQGLRKSR